MRPTQRPTRRLGDLLTAFDSVVAVDAELTNDGYDALEFRGIAVGSADVQPGDLFVALTGLRSHGAHYVRQALAAGAVAVLTDAVGREVLTAELTDEERTQTAVLQFVNPDQERATLGAVSAWFYGYPAEALTTVGITGTNGKTTTTYFVDAALSGGHAITALVGTVELRVGDKSIESPRTTVEAPVLHGILAMARERGASALTMEVSSHALALERVAGLTLDVVAFTNLQRDHLDFHGTMEQYFRDKCRLFDPALARRGVVCVDDEWGARLASEAMIPIDSVSTYQESPAYAAADWRVINTAVGLDQVGSDFTLLGPDGLQVAVHCPLPGRVNVSNAALAVVVAYRAGVPLADAAAGVGRVSDIPGRMERVLERGTGPLVIVDYAHTPDALMLALQAVRPITPGRLVLVFGSDGDRDQGKRPIMGEIAARGADVIVVTDENPRSEAPESIREAILSGIRKVRPDMANVTEVSPRWDAVGTAVRVSGPDDTVIITGKGHEPTQEIAGVFHRYNDRDAVRAAVS